MFNKKNHNFPDNIQVQTWLGNFYYDDKYFNKFTLFQAYK